MAKPKKVTTRKTVTKTSADLSRRVEVKKSSSNWSFFERVQSDLEKNNSFINLVLGTLIIVVLGVLLFNYFTKPSGNLGPSQQTENTQTTQSGDVSKESLPGKYTVKEGDTLFTIAQNYYNDGYQYPKIVEANKLANENRLEVGQVLEIPKGNQQVAAAATTETSAEPSSAPAASDQQLTQTQPVQGGQGGAENQTIWGEKITTNRYTVQAGDWLSKIAGRAYGNIMEYEKIAKANNIQNPDSIEVGTVLNIPR